MKTCINGTCLDSSHRLIPSNDKHQIRLEFLHFCDKTVSSDSEKDLEFLMFQNPSSIESSESDNVLITVYAVPQAIVPVSKTRKHKLS